MGSLLLVAPSSKLTMIVRGYIDAKDRKAAVLLWTNVFGYSAGHNDPSFVISQKIEANDGLFFIATDAETLVGTVMAGYDGHRGWIYSLAVSSECRKRGIGAALVRHAEEALVQKGCAKVNLQVIATNTEVVSFYEKLGYTVEPRISMGKKLESPISRC